MSSATVAVTGNFASGQDVLAFMDANGITGSYDAGTGVMALSGTSTKANYQAALRTVTYANSSDDPSTATRTITFTVNDGAANSNTQTRDITLSAGNDDPVNTVPGAQTLDEDTSLVFNAGNSNLISISDVDVAASDLQVTVAVTQGTLTLSGTTGLAFTAGDGTADATMTFTGTLANINTALDGLTYNPTADYDGADTLTLTTNDQGNTGAGGGGNVVDTVNITVDPIADQPSVTAATTNEDTQSSSGLVISRAGVDGAEVTHFKITNIAGGSLFQNDGTTPISDNDFITFAQGNAGLKFTPTADSVTAGSFDIAGATDAVGAGLGVTQSASITVTAQNDDPVNTVPGAQTLDEDTSLVFNAGNSNLISIADVDVAASDLQVTIAVTQGTVTLSGTTGLAFTAGDGTADATMTFTGTLASINTALDGLTYNPTADYDGADTLTLTTNDQGNTGAGGGTNQVSTVNITVDPVADQPSVTGATTNEDTQSSSGLVISRAGADGVEITHFKITNIAGGSLFQNDDTTAINDNDFITFAEGNAGLKFTPTADSITAGSFDIQGAADGVGAGLGVAQSASVTITPIGDTPTVTDTTTNEDTQSTTGLVISRNVADSTEVTHFKITSIAGGSLFKNDGTTAINDNDFITFAEANAGLKFTPTANSITAGTFDIQAGTDAVGGGLSASAATATVTVTSIADTPSITNATTNEDTQSSSGLVLSRNVNDSTEVTHFKVTNITGGTLFKNDGTTAITDNDFVTFAEGNAGLKFTPAADSITAGSFDIQGATDGVGGGLSAGSATATVTVTPIADTPLVTDATTNEDTQSASGLVVSRNVADSTEVTHFKITSITGGSLFKNDGTTAINDNDFITFAEGNAGLKFTPTADSITAGTFDIQGGTDGVGGGLSGSAATATVNITPIADTPLVTDATTNEDVQSSTGLVISRNVADSVEVTHFKITNITGGTLFKNDGTTQINANDFITFAEGNAGLKFTPSANSITAGSFDVEAATDGVGAGLSAGSDTATITVTPVADTPTVTSATTNEDTQSASGLVISRNAADGAEVTHFKITNIGGGTLFKNDGTTPINANDFITFAEGNAGLKFTPTADSVTAGSIDIQGGTDGVGGGLAVVAATAAITINPVNDTPVNTLPAAQSTNEDTALVLSTGNGNAISIADNASEDASAVQVALTATNGTISLSGTTGLTFSAGDGASDAAMTFTGTVASINAALNGASFLPTADFSGGSATLQINTNDQGNAGTGGALSDIDTLNITVSAVNDAPVLANAITNQTASEDQAFTFQVPANTFTDIENNTLNYAATLVGGGTLPSWLSFNGTTRTFTGTPSNDEVGSLSVDITANDGQGGTTSDSFTLTIANANDAPTVQSAIADQTTAEDQLFSFQVSDTTFADDDAGTTLSYAATLSTGGALPGWLSFNSGTRTFTGTPGNDSVGTIDVSVTASDGSGGSVSDTFAITVNNVNDAPTVQSAIADQTATEDQAYSFQFGDSTFDDIDGDTLTFSAASGGSLPAWLSFNAATRTFSGTPGNDDVGTVQIDVTADDGNGGTVSDSFDLTVNNANDAPTLVSPISDQTIAGGESFTLQFSQDAFADIDATDVLTYTATLTGGGSLPSWLSFTGLTRTFNAAPGASDLGTFSVNVTASDGNGGSVADSFNVTVIDESAPPTPGAPDLAAFSDSGASSLDNVTSDTTPTFTGTAESGSTVAIRAGGVTIGSGVANGGQYTITAPLGQGTHAITTTATDAANNTSAASAPLNITIDTTPPSPPLLTSPAGSLTSDNIPVINGTAESGATVKVFADGNQVASTVASNGAFGASPGVLSDGLHNFTAQATDAAGNISLIGGSLGITVDTAAPQTPATPVLAAGSDSGSSDSDQVTAVTTPTITGSAEDGSVVSVFANGVLVGSGSATGGAYSIATGPLSEGLNDITVQATDGAGNSSGASGSLSVTIDTTGPEAPSTPDLAAASDTGSSDSDDLTNDAAPTFIGTAEPGTTVTLFVNGAAAGTDAATDGTYTISTDALTDGVNVITATATDSAGNASAASAGLAVTVDITPPAVPSVVLSPRTACTALPPAN